jgi:hypothetical protein
MPRVLFVPLLGLLAAAAWAQPPAVTFVGATSEVNYRVAGAIVASPAALAGGEARLLFDYQSPESHYELRLAGEQAQFYRVKGGQSVPLGQSGKVRREAGSAKLAFSLQRRDWEMLFICNKVVCARAEDRSIAPGKVGWSVKGEGLSIEGVGPPQPVEELFFTDDFMRTGDQLGGWQALSGKWAINQQGSRASRSAKAFTYRSLGGGECLTVHGKPFDCDYVAQCAVRCDNDGAVGLAVGVQDAGNYYRLKWTSAESADGGTLRLQRVLDGQVTDLTPAIPGGFQPRVWYKLQLTLAGGWVYGWIDDVPQFEVAAPGFAEGLIGLWSIPGPNEEEQTAGANFDAVVERAFPLLVDDFTRPAAGRWTAVGPAWDLRYGNQGPAGAGLAAAPAGGQLLCGGDSWQNASFETDVSYSGGTVGLVACRQPDGQAYAALVTPDHAQLARLGGGAPQILASVNRGLPTGSWRRLGLSAEDGLLRLSLDGELVLDAYDNKFSQGPCGLLTDGAKGAVFTNVRAQFRPTNYTLPPTLPAEFVTDRYMTTWASPGAAWIGVEGSGARWHKGYFYGDRKVHFQIPGVGQQEGKVTVSLGAKDTTALDGYRLVVTLKKGKQELGLSLLYGDRGLGSATAAADNDTPEVDFELRGHFVLVLVGGKVVLAQRLIEEKP